jgi:hypothetical protein
MDVEWYGSACPTKGENYLKSVEDFIFACKKEIVIVTLNNN